MQTESAAPLVVSRPNILFVFSDDHAAHAIGAYASRINKTPNIDRLAAEGMRFDNCFCANSLCGPSRATILTGKHSHANGFIGNASVFDGNQTTFPKLLRGAGYQTAIVGKWHLKSEPTGFDHWQVLQGQGPYYNPGIKSAAGVTHYEGYTTQVLTDLALEYLREDRDPQRPFLLMYQHKAPHRNWQPGPDELSLFDGGPIPEPETLFDDWSGRASPAAEQEMTVARHLSAFDLKLTPPKNLTVAQRARWDAAYDPKNAAFLAAELEGVELVRWQYQRYIKDYLRCVAAVDTQLGRVLDYLDESGLARNTVVIYSSDQGFFLGDHGWYDKRWMYEEALRMPFIVRWPAVIAPGSSDMHLVQNIDFAQTFLDLAGVQAPADMQGASLVPLMRGADPSDWREAIYYRYYEFPEPHRVAPHFGLRTQGHKLLCFPLTDEWELFDLAADPQELQSIAEDPGSIDLLARLKRQLQALRVQYGDQ
ncbi:MAG TPA: DUF4976 domain-containing protein [Planctomycetes bacterium]|nr:DUF4976 domain-containing protein [Planctomycetota bacterium]HIL51798.1 DUF4976 domain-containing protein [Planctomycetota bacterium]